MKKLLTILGAIAVLSFAQVMTAKAGPCLAGYGGGTGLCVATSTNVGQFASVGSVVNGAPVWIFANASGTGGGSSTLIYAGQGILVNASGSNGYVIINNGVTSTAGNWTGTWQGVNSTTFYLASNPSGYLSSSTGLTYFFPATST